MKITFLGTGTSSGVPLPGCFCRVCKSQNQKNKRLRASIYIEFDELIDSPHPRHKQYHLNKDEASDVPIPKHEVPAFPGRHLNASRQNTRGILIDTPPDLRIQTLRAGITRVDAVLFTHGHADHLFGLDDLRLFNFTMHQDICVYANKHTSELILKSFSYAFTPCSTYEGGAAPKLKLQVLDNSTALDLYGMQFIPIPLKHGSLEVTGWRVNSFAYLTDCSAIPENSLERLKNIDVVVIDGLRSRYHRTHLTVENAVKTLELIKPKKAFLTHISHETEHEQYNTMLKKVTELDIELAYDGLVIEC